MSEIEKLYKNAHIEKVINYECTYDYGITCPNDNDTCENCGYYKEKEPDYQPFTAEKQLSLIKWLINFDYTHLSKLYGADINFSVVLAATINYLWKCLSKSEQEQIRSILNE